MMFRRLIWDWWSFGFALKLGADKGVPWFIAAERGLAAVITGMLGLALMLNAPWLKEEVAAHALVMLCMLVAAEQVAAWEAIEAGRDEDAEDAKRKWGDKLLDLEEERMGKAVSWWPWAGMLEGAMPAVAVTTSTRNEVQIVAKEAATAAAWLNYPILGAVALSLAAMMVVPGLLGAFRGVSRMGGRLPIWGRFAFYGSMAFVLGWMSMAGS